VAAGLSLKATCGPARKATRRSTQTAASSVIQVAIMTASLVVTCEVVLGAIR